MKRRHDERGASAVEFAIIASLLFMILFGTIQFGIAFNRYQGLQAAGREGARLASLADSNVPAIVQRVRDSVSIVSASAMNTYPCPANLNSLGEETGCVSVFLRTDPAVACPPAGSGCVLQTNSALTQPCSTSSSNSVVVQASYRMRLNIVLWSSPRIPVTGRGEFRCETS